MGHALVVGFFLVNGTEFNSKVAHSDHFGGSVEAAYNVSIWSLTPLYNWSFFNENHFRFRNMTTNWF